MPRAQRKLSESGYYHVCMRGAGRQLLFESNADRFAFLRFARDAFRERGIALIAWCLMDNHVHLVLFDEKRALSEAMHVLATRFARRFNGRSGHVGPVFQGRFWSGAVETDEYMLEAVRYVHANPERAGIQPAPDYPWSSYHEYVGASEFTDTSLVLDMLGGAEGFAEFMASDPAMPYDERGGGRVADGELVSVARRVLGDRDLGEVKGLPPCERNECLIKLRQAGLSIRQVERVTGVGRGAIARVTA